MTKAQNPLGLLTGNSESAQQCYAKQSPNWDIGHDWSTSFLIPLISNILFQFFVLVIQFQLVAHYRWFFLIISFLNHCKKKQNEKKTEIRCDALQPSNYPIWMQTIAQKSNKKNERIFLFGRS